MSEKFLEFNDEKIILHIQNQEQNERPSTLSWEISNVLSLECNLNFDKPSTVTLSIKKVSKQSKTSENPDKKFKEVWKSALILVGSLIFAYIIVLAIASFSILLAIVLGLLSLLITLPKFLKKFTDCKSEGVFSISVQDPIKLVEFEKALWTHPRGKKLMKSGFVLGDTVEEIFYVFLPASLYNSEQLRSWIEILTKVIYPIFVIILPLFCGICVAVSKNFKFLYKALRKDALIKLVWTVAEEGIDIIEDIADDYRWSRRLMKKVSHFLDLAGDVFEVAFKWVRMEVLLIFMQIEYFNHCYMKIWKRLSCVLKIVGSYLKKIYLGWLVKAVEKGTKTMHDTVRVKEINEIHNDAEELKSQISDVREHLDKKNQ